MWIIWRSDVVELVDAAALVASFKWSLPGDLVEVWLVKADMMKQVRANLSDTYHEPSDDVGVGRAAGTAELLLLTCTLDDNGIFEGS